MACYYDELGDYVVTPMLIAPCGTEPCCYTPTRTYAAYLPGCPKRTVCCERPRSKGNRMTMSSHDCCDEYTDQPCTPPRCSQQPPEYCPTCKNPCKTIKTKYVIPCYRYEDGRIERYVPTRHGRLPTTAYSRNGIQDQIHGYRGAIWYLCADECCVYTAVEPIRRLYPKITQEMLPVNQPTALMRRACEVAVGARPRRKPFVESSYRADLDQEVHRYVCQDERGNCCYHFEKKKNELCGDSCHACHSCPQCGDCVSACPVPPGNCYYYCC